MTFEEANKCLEPSYGNYSKPPTYVTIHTYDEDAIKLFGIESYKCICDSCSHKRDCNVVYLHMNPIKCKFHEERLNDI